MADAQLRCAHGGGAPPSRQRVSSTSSTRCQPTASRARTVSASGQRAATAVPEQCGDLDGAGTRCGKADRHGRQHTQEWYTVRTVQSGARDRRVRVRQGAPTITSTAFRTGASTRCCQGVAVRATAGISGCGNVYERADAILRPRSPRRLANWPPWCRLATGHLARSRPQPCARPCAHRCPQTAVGGVPSKVDWLSTECGTTYDTRHASNCKRPTRSECGPNARTTSAACQEGYVWAARLQHAAGHCMCRACEYVARLLVRG